MPNFRKVVLADSSHAMPLPPPHTRLFDKRGETVDVADPFWIARLADGSVAFAPDEAPAPAPALLALPAPAQPPFAVLADIAAGLKI